MEPCNKARRHSIQRFVKYASIASITSLAGYSMPAHAIWQEVARGIATGIAEFAQQSFEALTEMWVKLQQSQNDKDAVAKAKAKDQEQDFIVSLENKERRKAAQPLNKQCVDGLGDKYYTERTAKEAGVINLRKTFAGRLGNDIDPETKMPNRPVFVSSHGNTLSVPGLVERIGMLSTKSSTRTEFSQAEAQEIVSAQVGSTTHAVSASVTNIALAPDSINNPAILLQLEHSLLDKSMLSLSAYIVSSALNVEPSGELAVQTAHKDKLREISLRRDDPAFLNDIASSMNEVALAAELVKQIGERIYVQNAQIHENSKIIAMLAAQIIYRSLRAKKS